MTVPRVIRAAFNQGGTPTIACINKATISLGVNFDKLVSALQKFVDTTFAPIWGAPAKLVKADAEMEGAWTLVFLDDGDVQSALGYHDLTKGGDAAFQSLCQTDVAQQRQSQRDRLP
jgi:hypothetical protein